ncbi:hypothetical protein [Paenibacillus plantiphilus]|uniref:hypothetical protein n=1 Tax=Paenibacillus plantiphilus TaxID=2905650 RepID=UPI001F2C79AC|nr:hypothetical protein [Paenibacillus plantiphilus]
MTDVPYDIIRRYSNKDRLALQSGKVIIEGLVDTWKGTLEQSLGIKPEESNERQTSGASFGAVIGDDPIKPIIEPYFNAELTNVFTWMSVQR